VRKGARGLYCPRVRTRILLVTLLGALAVSVAAAGASRTRQQQLAVHAASLTQDGQQLIWRVDTSEPFSPAGLAAGRRSLCLLIERLKSGAVSGQLCIAGPARGGPVPRVVYQRITSAGPGPAKTIAATVTRSNDHELAAAFMPSVIGLGYQSLRWQVISTLRPPACIPAKPNRAGCLALFPRAPTAVKLHIPQLVGCVPSGRAFVDNGPSNRRVIALTFDDGPWYDTPQFLDILEHYHVAATFFEIGDQISEYGEGGAIERRMLADGDMIGDHTWNHPDIAGAGAFAAGEISQAAAAIKQATHGFEPCLLRAPYGDVSPALISEARSMGFTTIQWDIDPRDWALPGVGEIYDNVIANAHPGAIVIQHDGGGNRSETLAALPQEIQTLRSRGYQFVTITQLLGQRLIYR
jgi:peptidoglycan/xylan/chitin deacetylase (PgdA/CDA1 family)